MPRFLPSFLRWSFLRIGLRARHLEREWQVGDGREEALARYVLEHARAGDPADAIRVIDEFAYTKSFLINVGDEKGKILDDAVRRAKALRILELGTYCGYSALRMAVAAPEAKIVSIEFNARNADIARRVFAHAGVQERVQVVVGTLGDPAVVDLLATDYFLTEGSLDLIFIDHAKDAYLPDIQTIVARRWLRRGGLAVADNVKIPGAPEYRQYMKENQGKRWLTEEHAAHVEYQTLLRDLVLVSELLTP